MALHFLVRHAGYAGMSTDSPEVIEEVVLYGRIVCTLSIGPYVKWVNFP